MSSTFILRGLSVPMFNLLRFLCFTLLLTPFLEAQHRLLFLDNHQPKKGEKFFVRWRELKYGCVPLHGKYATKRQYVMIMVVGLAYLSAQFAIEADVGAEQIVREGAETDFLVDRTLRKPIRSASCTPYRVDSILKGYQTMCSFQGYWTGTCDSGWYATKELCLAALPEVQRRFSDVRVALQTFREWRRLALLDWFKSNAAEFTEPDCRSSPKYLYKAELKFESGIRHMVVGSGNIKHQVSLRGVPSTASYTSNMEGTCSSRIGLAYVPIKSAVWSAVTNGSVFYEHDDLTDIRARRGFRAYFVYGMKSLGSYTGRTTCVSAEETITDTIKFWNASCVSPNKGPYYVDKNCAVTRVSYAGTLEVSSPIDFAIYAKLLYAAVSYNFNTDNFNFNTEMRFTREFGLQESRVVSILMATQLPGLINTEEGVPLRAVTMEVVPTVGVTGVTLIGILLSAAVVAIACRLTIHVRRKGTAAGFRLFGITSGHDDAIVRDDFEYLADLRSEELKLNGKCYDPPPNSAFGVVAVPGCEGGTQLKIGAANCHQVCNLERGRAVSDDEEMH